MKTVKSILMFAVLLLIFVVGTGFLINHYGIYKRAYRELGRTISHQSIETGRFYTEEGCE